MSDSLRDSVASLFQLRNQDAAQARAEKRAQKVAERATNPTAKPPIVGCPRDGTESPLAELDIPYSHHASPTGIWSVESEISIPATDVISYAFEKCADWDKKIFVDVLDETRYLSGEDVRLLVRQLVKGFRTIGLQQGDCVLLHSPNNIVYPLLWLGAIGAGGALAGSNPAYTVSELTHVLKTTNTKYIVTSVDEMPLTNILAVVAQENLSRDRVYVFAAPGQDLVVPEGCHSWEELLPHGEADWNTYEAEEQLSKVVAVLGMTSGTTGLPKAAVISHRALVAQCEMMLSRRAEHWADQYQISQLICLPIYHAFAMPLALILPLRESWTTYIMLRFHLEDFTNAVSIFSITEAPVVPPIVAALWHFQAEEEPAIYLRTMNHMVCAGSAMNPVVQNRLYDRFRNKAVVAQCYGMIEMGWVSAIGSMERDLTGSVGRLMPMVEMKIVDEAGNLVTDEGLTGEACVRSPGAFTGYRNNAVADAKGLDSDGFYRTGDLVHISEGKVYIDGRVGDAIKIHAWQVCPEELEKILLGHADIADAAVAGARSETVDGLEHFLPKAFVVRKPVPAGARYAMASEIMSYVAERVVSYKRLAGGVVFVSSVPRSAAGKVLRRQLSDEN